MAQSARGLSATAELLVFLLTRLLSNGWTGGFSPNLHQKTSLWCFVAHDNQSPEFLEAKNVGYSTNFTLFDAEL